MSFDEEFLLALARALTEAKLEAIVIGMAAAAIQGAPVFTQDVDLLMRDTPLNRKKLAAVAKALHAGRAITRELSSVVTFVGGATPMDAMFDDIPGGLSFASIRSRSVSVKFGAYKLRLAALSDIIRSKKAAGRPKDLAALPILEAAAKVGKKL